MVYNGYYKVMSNIPKMGHLTTPVWIHVFRWKIVAASRRRTSELGPEPRPAEPSRQCRQWKVTMSSGKCPMSPKRCKLTRLGALVARFFWCPPAIHVLPYISYISWVPTDVLTWVSLGLKHVKTSSIATGKSTYADHWSKRPIGVDHNPEINLIGCTGTPKVADFWHRKGSQ